MSAVQYRRPWKPTAKVDHLRPHLDAERAPQSPIERELPIVYTTHAGSFQTYLLHVKIDHTITSDAK